jgi:antirestriction protein ArdC
MVAAVAHKAGSITRPLRAGGIPYRGVNVLMLWAAAIEKGYNGPVAKFQKATKTANFLDEPTLPLRVFSSA